MQSTGWHRLKPSLSVWLLKPPYLGIVWIAWLYVVACCIGMGGGPFAGRLAWFDDNVRMVQVLDWLNNPAGLLGGWYDHTITRVNPPDGFHTIWSRLVDLPIAAIIMPLQVFIGQREAALAASILLPLTQVLLLFFAAAYAARPLVGRQRSRLVTLFVLFTSCINIEYFTLAGFTPGAAGHHAWYVLLTLTLFGAMARLVTKPRMQVIAAGGACIGGLLAIGIEGLPLIALGCGCLAIISWRKGDTALPRAAALMTGSGAALGLLLLPANQPAAQWLTISFAEPSILGPLLLAGAALFFCLAWGLAATRMGPDARLVALLALAASFGGALFYCFPTLMAGGAAALSPAERRLALAEHTEAMSIFRFTRHNPLVWLRFIAPTALALGSCWYLGRQARTRRQTLLLFYGMLTGGCFLLATIYSRYFHYAQLTACPLLLAGWLVASEHVAPRDPHRVKSLWLYITLGPFWFLLLPAMLNNVPFASHVLFFPAKRQAEPVRCDVSSIADWLDARFPPETLLLTPLYDSDKFLFRTHLRLMFLASFPSQDRFIDAKRFYDTPDPGEARAIAASHHLDAVAVCAESYALSPHTTLANQLLRNHLSFGQQLTLGTVPGWLVPVDPHVTSPFLLFQVDKAKLAD